MISPTSPQALLTSSARDGIDVSKEIDNATTTASSRRRRRRFERIDAAMSPPSQKMCERSDASFDVGRRERIFA
jgi:hypothetical protein